MDYKGFATAFAHEHRITSQETIDDLAALLRETAQRERETARGSIIYQLREMADDLERTVVEDD